MDINFNLIYVILIITAIAFYYYSNKEYNNEKKNEKFIRNNLVIGSKIVSKTGIIGEVVSMNENSCIIVSGNKDNFSYFEITIDSVKSIIEA